MDFNQLYVLFKSGKFWIAVLILFPLVTALFVSIKIKEDFLAMIIYVTLFAGSGLFFWIKSIKGIEILFVPVLYAFWPTIFSLISFIIFKKNLSKRTVITLSIITLLLLFLAFSGCALGATPNRF